MNNEQIFRITRFALIIISVVVLCATLRAYTWDHALLLEDVSRNRGWISAEGRWLYYLLFPLLIWGDGSFWGDGSIMVYLNLLCFFLFAYTVARRYIKDSAYAFAFAALCIEISPMAHQLIWPQATLPAAVLLVAAALSVQALPIYIFYGIFGFLFGGTIQNLYFLLPLLHLPLLDGPTFLSNFRTLTKRIVPAWIIGFLLGQLPILFAIYGYTFYKKGIGQVGLIIPPWRRMNPDTGIQHTGVENLDDLATNTISSIGYLVKQVKILLLYDTMFTWGVLFVCICALVLGISIGRRHLPAKILSLGIALAFYVTIIPAGLHVLFRSCIPLAVGIASLLFLTSQIRYRMLVGQMVLLICLSVVWSAQSINTLHWRTSIHNTYYYAFEDLLKKYSVDPKQYAGLALLSGRSTTWETTASIKNRLGLPSRGKGFSTEHIDMELPEHWKAVAITAGFRDVLLCGRNESHESLAICREIKSRFVNEINEPRDTQSNWLYTIVGEHENYLILSIKIPEAGSSDVPW